MKLNYSPLQHGVDPVEPAELSLPLGRPVAAFQLHGHLAPVVWAAAQERPRSEDRLRADRRRRAARCLFGDRRRTARSRPALRPHHRGARYGGEAEAMTTAGALHAGFSRTRLGLRGRGAGSRNHRLGHRARPWRHDRARHAAHRTGARLPGGAGRSRVKRRPARAPPRNLAPHAIGAAAAACAEVTVGLGPGAPRVEELARHQGHRHDSGSATATPLRACRPARWGATSRTTSCSLSRRWRAESLWLGRRPAGRTRASRLAR